MATHPSADEAELPWARELVWDTSSLDRTEQRRVELHSRLVLFSTVFLLAWLGRALIFNPSTYAEYSQAFSVATMLVVLGILLLLWRTRPSLLRLQILVAVVVVVWCMRNALVHIHSIDRSEGLSWFTLVVAYGVLIPGPWQRCAAVALLVSALALTLEVWLLPREEWFSVVRLAGQLGAAAIIAAFTSAHMNSLSQVALQARKLGQYHLKRKLGEGGMGEIYLAQHFLLRRPCAVKVIRPDRVKDPSTEKRFEREVDTLANLTHWNIVRVFDFGRANDGTFFYVMEYLPGLDLGRLVERYGPMPVERAVFVLRQICWALREAHQSGLIHRDVKPTNIILCERGKLYDVAKLVDFGLVAEEVHLPEASKVTQEGRIVGTPLYMSPEQVAGNEMDGRSDLYSLGAVAYFLLTGRPPFDYPDPRKVFAAHLTEAVTPLRARNPAVPADVEAIILLCLEKKPADRFRDAAALETALAGCSAADQWSWARAEEWWRQFVEP